MALNVDVPEIGEQLIRVDRAESTNKLAAELIELSKVQHGSVILAREQTAGRGQMGRTWISQPGKDLTLSIVLRTPSLRVEDQFLLSKMAALAVRDVVCHFVPEDVWIKWPNDIFIGRRKVAGILIKNEIIGDLVLGTIIGVGLNVNSTEFPETLMATSLSRQVGKEPELEDVLALLMERMRFRWARFKERDRAQAKEYSDLLWSKGRWAPMVLDGNPISLRPMDVDEQGRLLVEQEDGQVLAYGLDRLRFAPR